MRGSRASAQNEFKVHIQDLSEGKVGCSWVRLVRTSDLDIYIIKI